METLEILLVTIGFFAFSMIVFWIVKKVNDKENKSGDV